MASDKLPQSSREKKRDSRLDRFLRKAAPIIAAERGINARSQVKLRSLAQDMKLSEEQYEKALKRLKDVPAGELKKRTRYERAFTKFLKGQLAKISSGILNSELEGKAIRIAVKKYQLKESQAREILQEVTTELGVTRITTSEAQRHVEAIIREKVGDAAWVDDATRRRLHAAASQWGLSAAHVDVLVNHYTHSNLQGQRRDRRTSNVLIAAASVFIFALGAGFLFFIFSGQSLSSLTGGAPDSNGDHPGSSTSDPNENVNPLAWWTEDLQLKLVRARLHVKGFNDIYATVASEDPLVRQGGYEELANLIGRSYDDRRARDRMKSILIGLAVQDPSAPCSSGLVARLLALASTESERLPDSPKFYSRAFWSVRVAAEMLTEEDISTERHHLIRDELAGIAYATPGRSGDRAETVQRYLQGLSQVLLRHLIDHAATNPTHALACYEALTSDSSRYLNEEQQRSFQTQFLVACLPAAGPSWDAFRDLIVENTAQSDALNQVQLIGIYESLEPPDLQAFLGRQLLRALKVTPESNDVEGIASALRKKLGVTVDTSPARAGQRWTRLKRESTQTIARVLPTTAAAEDRLKQLVELAYLGTVACALSQDDDGAAYDELVSQKSALISGSELKDESEDPGGNPSRPSSRPTQKQQDRLNACVQRLAVWKRHSITRRISTVKELANLAERQPDITYQQAISVARYLVARKNENEHLEILVSLNALGKWAHLLMAVADVMEQSELKPAWNQQIAAQLMDVDLLLDESSHQAEFLRDRLLAAAASRLAESNISTAGDENLEIDRAENAFALLYHRRALLLNPRAGSIGPLNKSPTVSVQQMMQVMALRLEAFSSDPLVRRLLDSVSFETQIARYVGGESYQEGPNDMRQTVWLLRILVQLTAAEAVQQLPLKRIQIDQILARWQQSDQKAVDLIQQMTLCETALLEIWLLYESDANP